MPTRPFPYLLATSHAALIALILYSAQVGAAPMRADCPATLARTDVKVVPPSGWIANVPEPLILAVAGVMGGPPESELFLIPASKKGAVTSETWRFDSPGGNWLWCGDGAVTGGLPVVQFGLQMDDNARSTLTRTGHGKRGAYSLRCER